jgi:hypothetical protein
MADASHDDLERLLLARSPRFQALLNKSRRSIRAGQGLSRDAFWAAVKQRAAIKNGPNAPIRELGQTHGT